MKKKYDRQKFMLCIENRDCDDLEVRKIYQILPDEDAAKDGYLRVIDESGEDYLYPKTYFIAIELPIKVQEELLVASS